MTGTLKIIKDIFSSKNIRVITLTQSLFMLTATLWWPYWSRYIIELGATKYQLGIVFMLEQAASSCFSYQGASLLTSLAGRRSSLSAASFGP